MLLLCALVCLLISAVPWPLVNGRSDTGLNLEELTEAAYPEIFNAAKESIITTNATCGQSGPEAYCHYRPDGRESECDVCDSASLNPDRRHPITNAIDNTSSWWQSPSLQSGRRFEYVTITIDLKQEFHIHYVRIKAAHSPLPGNWILERSIDGTFYKPWQYFANSNSDCWRYYGTKPFTQRPSTFRIDDDVICTAHHANLRQLQNGEINVNLIEGRPGAELFSSSLKEFIKARYIRMRFQKFLIPAEDRMTFEYSTISNQTTANQLYYTLREIEIGAQCMCNGHAKKCPIDRVTQLRECECLHNTCGDSCIKCCPLFNQRPFKPATKRQAAVCEACECYGHSDHCVYDAGVASRNASINALGKRQGGGVCVDCKHHTTGNNCDQCVDGYFRPKGMPKNATNPCRECQCRGRGTTEFCIKDDSQALEGLAPGDCICKQGFQGKNCESCAPGYKNYPRCEPCTCKYEGVINPNTCDGPCICKKNVEGPRCDRCKPGFYNLAADNPDGCSPCFCFGATSSCKSSDWGIEIVSSPITYLPEWRVSDLNGQRVINPGLKDDHLVVADDDMSVPKPYYWQAPREYLSEKLYSYGGDLRFLIGYTILRGDVSGFYTEEPDIIVEGGPNNLRMGHNWKKYDLDDEDKDKKALITLPLREQEWFILDNDGRKIRPATREEFTLVIYDLKRLLIRAKFHTDQVEGSLYEVEMEKASNDSKSLQKQIGAEACNCPEGYAGLSCELCAPGYRRVNNVLVGGQCVKCDCNNHADSCDPYTGECSECLHNTEGPNCGRCKPGFYGIVTGKIDDCKPCACPLTIPSNNFSPTCHATSDGDYECDECQHPYTGKKCELCKDGFYGDPTVPGGECLPCECGPNVNTSIPGWCDSKTGQCRCEGNITGWKCDQCPKDHWGNPDINDCRPCGCHGPGSLDTQCNPKTGQCPCKPNFTGRFCDFCAPGYGNIELDCPACACNPIGSQSLECDQASGKCHCKPGVFGQHCTKCMDGYYGFGPEGCSPCDCHPKGSEDETCDEATGQCKCRPYVIGRDCSRCAPGTWNIDSGRGCENCNCDPIGSISPECDITTGQCQCKPGVGGLKCDQCKPGYYGLSATGCLKCDECFEPNHICNPKTGKCECPPNTAGKDCRDCAPGTYGLDIQAGCKVCECNVQGSVDPIQCHNKTGQCLCLDGFEGLNCDRCRFGFYRFPNCRRCDCYPPGTKIEACRIELRPETSFQDGPPKICQCDDTGQCPCRANTMGRRCDRCKDATFSLTDTNPFGCFSCFCFERTPRCDQSKTFWHAIHAQPREVSFGFTDTPPESRLGFNVIPSDGDNAIIGSNSITDQPYYWQLPKEFLGDHVGSYNGFITFRVQSKGGSRFPDEVMKRYPLIIIQGNHRLTFYHFEEESYSPISPFIGNLHKVQLHESSWIMAENPRQEVTRKHMMIALQKVQHILIRATHGPDTQSSSLNDVMMDTSSDVIRTPSLNYTAIGVEQCRCPPQYTGPSCQDPNIGYCRKRKPNYLDSKDYIDLVGWAEPCQCNNRSNVCDRETCHCFNCTGNTAGPYCNICAPGHYGDPTQNIPCLPCACPLPGHSFAKSCETRPGNPSDYICECEEGYTGERCEKCAPGYFGNPLEKERCLACNCSPYGSIGNSCDPKTGQCICKEGFRGRDCSICLPRHVQTEQGCISCDGPCEGLLLDDLDSINATLADFPPDWPKLPYIKFLHLLAKFNNFLKEYQQRKLVIANGRDLLESIRAGFGLDTFAQMLMLLEEELENRATQADIAAHQTVGEAEALLDLMQDLHDELLKIVKQLRQLAGEGSIQDANMAMMLNRAEQILSELTIRNFGPRREQAEREYRKAKALLDRILALLKLPRLDQKWADRLTRLMKLLSAIIKENQERVQQPLQVAIASINRGQRLKNTVITDLKKSEDLGQQAERDLAEARLLINRARAALDDFDARRGLFPGMERHLRDAALRLKELYEKLFRLNPEYSVKHVDACRSHAQQLQNQLDYLKSLFFDTENVSRYAVVAANVYQRIIDAINRAEKSAQRAHEAAERAYKEVYPSTDQSVLKWAANAKEKSLRLLEAAKALKDKAALLKQDLDGKKAALDRLEGELSGFTREINTLIEEIEKVETQMKTIMGKTDEEISATLENLGRIHSRIDIIVNLITQELTTGLKRLEDGTASGLDNITKLIEQARANIRDSLRLLVSSENLRDRVDKVMDRLDIDLTDLRHRIMLSRQKASSIRISLKADRDDICYKSYRPETEPSSSNSISLNYAIDDDRIQNSILLYISEKSSSNISLNERDFMCVEMVNRKIRLSWNLGYGPRSIEHPLRIETMDKNYKSLDGWYKVEVVRINNVAQLIVRPSSSTHKPDLQSVSASSDSRGTRANFNSQSDFYIGSLPDEIQTTKAISNRRFIGCIHEVFFDEKRIGLWNFITSQGCRGCVEGFIEPYDHETFFFKGDQSYALMDQIQHYDREKYMIAFHFKTFDENAMIFFTGNPDTGDFVSIALEGGVVIYQLGIANSARLQLRSSQKYNTGKWVRLAAEREGLHGSLYVEDEIKEGYIERTSSSPQLDLNHVQIYFGGVVPNFTQSAWHNVIFKPFLGCMKSVQIDATPLNLLNIESFGVLAGCKDRTWRSARFYGRGYLELKGHPIREDDDLSFTVATNQSDVLLLLSTFAGLPSQIPRLKDSHFYSLAIVNGLLEIRINGGAGSIVLVSETRINDGQYHTISLSRRKRKVTVSLDDRESTFSRLSKGTTIIEASDKGGLYLGGAPDFIMLRGMANTKNGLVGVIRDFAFSGKIVKLNEPVSFRDVGIGRS